jgi:hypothetical protein
LPGPGVAGWLRFANLFTEKSRDVV